MRLPGRGSSLNPDDRLVVPEATRDELVNGRRMEAFPAEAPHANQHSRLDYVLQAHAAPGYHASCDLLTRHGVDSDFASDACVYKAGLDPATGGRHLEEIAFEVVSTQNAKLVTEKAVQMARRGVRRIFAVWVKKQQVREWAPETKSWSVLAADSQIVAPCLVKPLQVAALLDAAVADNEVVEALAAKGNPVIRKREATAKAEGKAEGLAEAAGESVLEVLAARGIAVSEEERQEVLRCRDLHKLRRWLRRAALVSSADEVLAES